MQSPSHAPEHRVSSSHPPRFDNPTLSDAEKVVDLLTRVLFNGDLTSPEQLELRVQFLEIIHGTPDLEVLTMDLQSKGCAREVSIAYQQTRELIREHKGLLTETQVRRILKLHAEESPLP